jgi:predicted small lipoprotein YifL
MKKAFIVMLGLATALSLAGCTLFYPNSGSVEDGFESTSEASEAPAESGGADQSPSPSPSVSPTMAPAQLGILYSDASGGRLNVVAEVSNFAEDGGSCTLNYYKGTTATVLGTVQAERNVTTTQCFPFDIDLASVPKGALQLTVSYLSENHIGESDKFEVNIP